MEPLISGCHEELRQLRASRHLKKDLKLVLGLKLLGFSFSTPSSGPAP